MYKKLKFIALVPNSSYNNQKYTMYFLEKEEKIVIPIDIDKIEAKKILSLDNINLCNEPPIYDTTKRIIHCFDAKLTHISIYKYNDPIYYAYINLFRNGKYFEVNTKLTDAINLAKRFTAEIFVNKEILHKQGIKINQKMIKDALAKD